MNLARHHTIALGGAVLTSAIALTDAVTHGLTDGFSPFSDESDLTALVVAGILTHGLAYLALAAVLVAEGDRFRPANRATRGSRWVVLVSLVTLAAGFLTVQPVVTIRDAYDGPVYAAFGVVAGLGFAGLLGGALVLGLAQLRSPALGSGGTVLGLMLPVLGLTLLLSWLSPPWAHPAYLETVTYLGLALVGVGAQATQPASRATTASPTSAV